VRAGIGGGGDPAASRLGPAYGVLAPATPLTPGDGTALLPWLAAARFTTSWTVTRSPFLMPLMASPGSRRSTSPSDVFRVLVPRASLMLGTSPRPLGCRSGAAGIDSAGAAAPPCGGAAATGRLASASPPTTNHVNTLRTTVSLLGRGSLRAVRATA